MTDPRYGYEHQRTRAAWAPIVATGTVACVRCGKTIAVGQRWHLDHEDDRVHYKGPAHAICNITAAGHHGSAIRASRTKSTRAL